jgi:hypothetical protein
MADDSKINIYVNSKNRRTDETSSNFNVIIPDGLLKVNNNQSFELNVISFNCVNSFYHCNNNTNRFQIIFRNNLNNLYMVQDYYLTNGNPNVYDVLNNINTLTSVYMTTTYNRITNKYSFTRIYAQTTNYYNMYIKPINSYNFLGLVNSVEFLINFTATECTYPINIMTIKSISIGISGDISFRYNNMESSNKGVYKASDLILVKAIDVNKNELLLYENVDGGDSFRFDLGNRDKIKYFVLSVYDQDGNTITDMTDYFMHVQFIIRTNNEVPLILNKVLDYNKESYLILGHTFDLINNMYSFLNKIVMNYFKKYLTYNNT